MCHILIIEDELFIALDLEALLRKEGATSFSFAQTEAEAVTEALAHRPSLITSDMTLSEGTGPQAVAAIHEALGDIPVIFITATPSACGDLSPNHLVLSKPLNSIEITSAYQRLNLPSPRP